jgi:hypothetical protein
VVVVVVVLLPATEALVALEGSPLLAVVVVEQHEMEHLAAVELGEMELLL